LAVIVYLGVFVIPAQYQDLQKSIESKQKLIELAKQPTPPPNQPVKQPPPGDPKLPRQIEEIKANAKLDRVSFSSKFNRLVTAGLEPPVAVVWDAQTRQPIADFPHPAGVRFVEWHPQGLPQFVTACNDGGVRIFDVERKQMIREWNEDKKTCLTAVYSPAGLLVAAGGEGQIVHVWKTDTGEARCHLQQHTGTINAITWLPDGRHLISSAYDGLALLWDVSAGQVVREFKHQRGVHTHALSRDGKLLATGQSNGQINLWEVESGQLLYTNNDLKQAVWFVVFNSDGRRLAAAGADKRVLVFDVPAKRRIAELTGHSDGVPGLAWLPDSKKLISVSLDRTIRVWEISR
jgi:WD40 repeat protein